ncbi:E3 ubiquitin-protein ligase TRIM39 [Anabarilius grahami]|uniref:E3 ubiquitin-protein ligase TRIM39 n=1 Tax=Anabarilius grahami TaxID=495550 RepID=A0A3N0Y9H9_ANAGA|nr:E3 ubiquitin-protein ligase TRIM39 [Anabarilius grahami]
MEIAGESMNKHFRNSHLADSKEGLYLQVEESTGIRRSETDDDGGKTLEGAESESKVYIAGAQTVKMASLNVSAEELSCPVCCEIFKTPVLLSCSHSVCKECLQQFWRTKKTQECPVCRRRSSKSELPVNLVLKNLCESFLTERNETSSSGSEEICSLHSEKLKLFCLEDKQPACLVCFTSKKHDNHKFRPISEVVSAYKEELNTALKSLQKKIQHNKKMKGEFEKTVQHIKSQVELTERQIKQQFEKLHQFLRDEEEATITALREEEEQKKQMMKEKLEEMNRHISALSHTIKDMEEMMKASDVCFLKEFPVSKESVRRSRNKQPLPDNPERFDWFECVLGSEGFNSGTHCWDVEVKGSSVWALGVTTASNQRKEGVFFSTDVWCVSYSQYGWTPGSSFHVKQKLDRVRVNLDYDRGRVSFSDPVTNTHLHTFTHTFTHTLFPVFRCFDSLRILPVNSQ